MTDAVTITLKVSEALGKDVGRAYARMDPEDLKRLGAAIGDILVLEGTRQTVCKAMPAYKEMRGRGRVQLDGISRENAGVKIDASVGLRKEAAPPAHSIHLTPIQITPEDRDLAYIGSLLDGLPVVSGDRIRTSLFGSRWADFTVNATQPQGAVLINPTTQLHIDRQSAPKKSTSSLSYEDIGGLKPQLQRIREMIELPLRYPQIFEQLGIGAPKGVLLHGPPGCGKTLIARAIAHETEAAFFSVNGPEVIHKFYGESEAHLRKIFDQAARKGPSIIFLDEIDAIAPKREKVVGDVEKRVVAQLLALMDGLGQRQHLIVIAATNLPNALDPALRRPGRFDREIAIPIPNRIGRTEILQVHSRGMPLADDVSLEDLAAITHGYVGADLQALCREAAMACLRRVLPEFDFSQSGIPYERLADLKVLPGDFTAALREVSPSAIREVFVEVPDVRWEDVGGLETTKQQLKEAVQWPLTHAALFKAAGTRPPKGILLAGPPGCGKTLLAKAIAHESRINFISVKGPALLSRYVGASEEAVRDTFGKARQAAPCIVFFDEIDALAPSRGDGATSSQVTERVLSQFLTEMDGIEALKGVCVLGATNRKDLLDAAILRPGRFDAIIDIPLPDDVARQAIFDIHLGAKPCSEEVDTGLLSSQTNGFSGADIAAVCHQAAMAAIRREVKSRKVESATQGRLCIASNDLGEAIEDLKHRQGAID